MRWIVLLLLLWVASVWGDEAILQLDTGGHQGIIRDVLVSRSGEIISASSDKTIRVWDGKTGKEKRKILGQIGDASEGMIYALALSPDEKILAVGGYMKDDEIRLYDYASGQIIQLLKGHSNVVNSLNFDAQGNLYSASSDKSVRVWSPNRRGQYSLHQTLNEHTSQAYGVRALPSRPGYFVSVGYDNRVILYNGADVANEYTYSAKLKYVAASSRYIVATGKGEDILVFDTSLNLIKKIKSVTQPSAVAFSPDESKLIVGSSSSPRKVAIYDTTRNFQLVSSYDKHTNIVIATGFLDNKTAVSCGGDNNEIDVWDIYSTQMKYNIIGNAQTIWRVGLSNNIIGFGNTWKKVSQNELGPIERAFDLNQMQMVSPSSTTFRVIDSHGLSRTAGGDYGYDDATLVFPNGTRVTRDTTDGLGHNTYGWYRNYILSGGSNGHLCAYDQKGKMVSDFIGHIGEMWNIALDRDLLVSGNDDQTMKLWDMSQVGQQEKMDPILTLFVGTDNEWVIFTPSGYYAASPHGDQYVGWHINQGQDKESLFFPVGKFKAKYYNPDLITKIIGGMSESEALAQLGKVRETPVAITDALPPFITPAQFPEVLTSTSDISLKVRVVSRTPITGYKYLFNGRPLETTKGLKPAPNSDGTITLDLTVPKESGSLSIIAINANGYSDPTDFQITYQGAKEDILKPKLYILSIGVSRYGDKELTLQYAAKDAQDFANVWQSQKGKLYRDVVVKVLTDAEATKDNILDGLDWIQKQTTSRDVAVIYIGGHGVNDEAGQFYYLPVGVDTEKLKRTGVAFSDFKNTLSAISGKVMLFADACHSGNIMGARKGVDTNGMIAELNDAQNGVVVFTSSTGKQYSLEDQAWGNGAFTKALVEGLNGRADLLGKGKITVDTLSAYVSDRVKELTNGRQTPTMGKPDTISDFPIGMK